MRSTRGLGIGDDVGMVMKEMMMENRYPVTLAVCPAVYIVVWHRAWQVFIK